MFIRSRSFLVESLESFKYGIILSADMEDLTESLLFFFSCFVLAWNVSHIMNDSGESEPHYLVSDFGGNDLFFPV
jgi:hypothetical protein